MLGNKAQAGSPSPPSPAPLPRGSPGVCFLLPILCEQFVLSRVGRHPQRAGPVLAMRPQQAPVSGKVFIQRDYSSGTRCQFQTKFPAELENRIDRQQFEETVRTLNNLYAEAEKLGGQSYLEGCLACLTAYTIFLCMETHYEKVLKKVSKYIQEQNEKIYAPQGLLLTDPIERGLRVIEITIYEDRGMSSGR
uniref:Golgin subfamily A member 7 n=2 Tax=Caniformia TaxID=379584 RepID=A0A8C0RMC5_CANLF